MHAQHPHTLSRAHSRAHSHGAQIYMELIQDLLRPESENLAIRENEGGVFLSGAHTAEVENIEQCLHLLQASGGGEGGSGGCAGVQGGHSRRAQGWGRAGKAGR